MAGARASGCDRPTLTSEESMSQRISSAQNPRIKQAARLRDRRGRQRQGRIIVDGRREICRALGAGIRPLELFLCESGPDRDALNEVLTLLKPSGVDPIWVTPEVFDKIAFGHREEGAVLVVAEPTKSLAQLAVPGDGLVCVLEQVEKPGNLGAVIRTADAAGVAAVIVADGATDLFNPNTIRASLGAVFRVPVCAAPAADVRDWLVSQQYTIFAARVDGAVDYTAADFRAKSAVVLGSEARGLSDIWRGTSMVPISLPMLGSVDSLNVSATAAVLFYEALRQRRSGQHSEAH